MSLTLPLAAHPALPPLDFLTAGVLQAAMPRLRQPPLWIGPMTQACRRFGITTRLRLAAFLATVGHESADLTRLSESLNYTPAALLAVFPTRISPTQARALGRVAGQHPADQPRLAELLYGGRMGNSVPGDAWRHRGAGAIQLTGFGMHDAFAVYAGIPTAAVPDYLQTPDGALLSAGWYWHNRGLNALADAELFDTICCRVNGASTAARVNGIEDRRSRYRRARAVLTAR